MTEAVNTRPPTTPEIVELVEQPAAVVRLDATIEEFPRRLGEAFGLAATAIAESGAAIAGHPFARYLGLGERIVAEAGFPFGGTLVPTDRVLLSAVPGGRVVTTTHVGSYDDVGQAWDRAMAWMGEHQLEATGPAWEAYLTGPDEPGPPVTQIFWPVR